MSNRVIKLNKGADVRLKGEANKTIIAEIASTLYALKPTDFSGITPKLNVRVGDKVKRGTTVFFDKKRPEIKFASPTSGTIKDIVRGDKRKILEIIVQADQKNTSETFKKVDLLKADAAQIISTLTSAGLWPFIIQRPFDIIAQPTDKPKAIFISGFDSNPLAPDYALCFKDAHEDFQFAIDVLNKLSSGGVFLSLKDGGNSQLSSLKNAKINHFKGPHPAGNVGVQIHHLNPINKGDVVWTVSLQGLAAIGKFVRTGEYDVSKTIALTGSSCTETGYFKVNSGAAVESIIDQRTSTENTRFISGNPFTGKKITPQGYLGFYDMQITCLPEVIDPEFFGWIIPKLSKKSFSRAFFSWLMPNKTYDLNTSMNGEERAFVVSGQYERFLPMDILPVQLIKSILINDIELMENLGIYEVAPEDFALCEFACTSKQEVQSIIRMGLDNLQKEFA